MYRKLFLSLVLIAAAKISVAETVLPIQHWTTQNGAEVYFVHAAELPMVDVEVAFAAGSARDGAQPGLAHFVNEMLGEATTEYNAQEIASRFENVGAIFGTDVNRDMSSLALRTLSDPQTLNAATDMFSNVIAHTTFPDTEFKLKQKQASVAFQMIQQSPGTLVNNQFYKTVYGQHPYAHPVIGDKESVMKISQKDLNTFYKKHYVAKNATIAIVGALDQNAARALSEKIIKDLPAGQAAAKLPQAPNISLAQSRHIQFDSSQTHIAVGQVGITPNDPDYFPLMVGNYAFGGSSMISQLGKEIREARGLAYDVRSSFEPLAEHGPFIIQLQTRTDKAHLAQKLVCDMLQVFVNKGPSDQELTDAKSALLGSFPLRIKDNNSIMANLVYIGFYRRPIDYLDTYRENINAVTVEQVHDAFKRRIYPNKLVIVTLGKLPE